MAYEIPGGARIGTLLPNSSLFAGYQYRGVAASTVLGKAKIPGTTTGKNFLGVLQNAPSSNEPCEIWPACGCVTKVLANSTLVTIGKRVFFGTDGIAKSSTGANTGALLFGPVLETCGSTAGAIISLVLQPLASTF